MSYTSIEISHDAAASEVLPSHCLDASMDRELAQSIKQAMGKIVAGSLPAEIKVRSGAVRATATLTVSSTGSSNSETMTLCGVTITAVTSGAAANEFDISTTPATQATNMAAAINASSDLSGLVTASANGAVVTITAVQPGKMGNGLDLTESLTNVAKVAFSGGSDGTSATVSLGK